MVVARSNYYFSHKGFNSDSCIVKYWKYVIWLNHRLRTLNALDLKLSEKIVWFLPCIVLAPFRCIPGYSHNKHAISQKVSSVAHI